MFAIKAVFDGTCFRLSQPLPVKEKYEVVITFIEPIKEDQSKLLDYFNCLNGENALDLDAIMNERMDFSSGRPDHDFS